MPWGLAQGERALGLESHVLVLMDSWLQYPANRLIFKNYQELLVRNIFGLGTLVKEIYRIRNHYDVFHFNFGTSLIDLWRVGLPLLDLPFYKRKGKIVVTYNGCDARQKYKTIQRVSFSPCHNDDCYNGRCNSGARDKVRQRKIAKFGRCAEAIFAVNPDLLYFLPERAKFLPYAIANWTEIETSPYKGVNRKLKILHSPTNRAAKGSDIIIRSLDLLKQRYGDRVEVILVENLPQAKARQVYAEAHLAIDQVLIGWYGGFAVEVMKMGKPVMAFIRKEDLQFLPQEMAKDCQKAIILIEPLSIFEKLCEIIENPSILRTYREAALEYVYKWHDPVYVAGITKTVYES
jgi:hypothetical protein